MSHQPSSTATIPIEHPASRRKVAAACAAFTAFLWGLSFLSTKVLLTELPPIRIAFLRFIIASVILRALMIKVEPKTRLHSRDILLLAISGALGTTLYFLFENTGLRYTSASSAVLVISAVPAMSIAVQAIVHKQRISGATLTGILVSMAGVALVVGPDTLDFSSSRAMGNLLILGAAFSWVAFNEAAKPLFSRYGKLSLTTYTTWFGTALLAPIAILEQPSWSVPSVTACLHLMYLAVFCSALGYILYLYALDMLGSTVVTSYLNLVPVVGVIGSATLLGERLSFLHCVGGLIIIVGISIVSRKH